MPAQNSIPILLLLIALFHTFLPTTSESLSSSNYSPRRFSPNYAGVRAAYWSPSPQFPASSTETNYFTHIYYAFLQPDPHSFTLIVSEDDQTNLPNFISGLQSRHPPVKTLLSIGGAGNNKTVFAIMASTKESREAFINSTIQVARHYGFDGVDLDWEFPETKRDMANLALLYKEWRCALNIDAKIQKKPRLLFTSAVYYASAITTFGIEERSFPAEVIRRYLDWVSPMCFDYHGSTWENVTGFNSVLYDYNSNISTYYGIGSWIKAGVPPKKLVMGLPLYGQAWKLQDPGVNGLGAVTVGPATDTDNGTIDYFEILKFNEQNYATVVYNGLSVGYYSYAGSSWISYDDVWSIRRKVLFAKSLGLRGYFFWALGKDKDWAISREASNAWGY